MWHTWALLFLGADFRRCHTKRERERGPSLALCASYRTQKRKSPHLSSVHQIHSIGGQCRLSLRGCEKMGTGSATRYVKPRESRQREVPVPIFSQALRESTHLSRGERRQLSAQIARPRVHSGHLFALGCAIGDGGQSGGTGRRTRILRGSSGIITVSLLRPRRVVPVRKRRTSIGVE